MASKTDLIETKHVDTAEHEWIAYIPGKDVLAQGGDTEAEAIVLDGRSTRDKTWQAKQI